MKSSANAMPLSRRVTEMKQYSISKFFDIAATMKDVISLGIGEPDFGSPQPVLQAGIDSLNQGETHYTANAGKLALRQAIADHLERLYGVRYDPATEILVTVGVSEGLYLTMNALLDPGDEVILPTPTFVSYPIQAALAGGVPVEVPGRAEDGFALDPDRIRAAVTPRTKAIVLGYPNNPTGAVASRASLLQVALIAAQHNLFLVSDEIYDRLVYGVPHVCVPGLGEDVRRRTILLGGFSKDYAMTGLRIGYAAAPQAILKGLVRIHQYTVMSASTTSQDAARAALLTGEPAVAQMVAEYDRRRRLIVPGLNRLGLATSEPRGAFYAFARVGVAGMDDETFSEVLLREEHVAVVPGDNFGAAGQGFVRLSYATAYEKIEEALRRMERFMSRHG